MEIFVASIQWLSECVLCPRMVCQVGVIRVLSPFRLRRYYRQKVDYRSKANVITLVKVQTSVSRRQRCTDKETEQCWNVPLFD
jgi:hypothetical protein